VFTRKQKPAPDAAASTAHDAIESEPAGKGRPTPKRKQAEAANRRPLVPADRKLAAQTERGKARSAREREYQALRTGDERYLPARDKGPQRRWIRDYVDARWSPGEFFLPIALGIVFATMLFAQIPAAAFMITVVLYGLVLLTIVDAIVMTRVIKGHLAAKFGADKIERGSLMYAVLRSMQIRRVRLPKALVKRGQHPR